MGSRQEQVAFFLAKLEAHDAAVAKAFLVAAERVTDAAVLKQLAAAIATADTEAVINLLGLGPGTFAPLDEALRSSFMTGAEGATVGMRPGSYGTRLLVQFNVRNQGAEAILSEAGARRVTGYLSELRDVIADKLLYGLERGQNPLTTARELVGTLKAGSQYRKGGTLMLTRPRAATVDKARAALLAGDPVGMRAYLGLKGRDKRFDRLIKKAISEGTVIDSAKVTDIVGKLADNYLKERARAIARTETLSALNTGKREAFRQAMVSGNVDDAFVTRDWDSTGDKLVRPDHVYLDKQGKVSGFHTPYRLPDGSTIMHPGDMEAGAKQVANCRCIEYIEVDWFQGRG